MADQLMSASTMTSVVETAHRSAILPLVLSGVGVAVLSSAWSQLAQAAGARVCRLVDSMELQVDVIHRPVRLTPAAQVVVDRQDEEGAGLAGHGGLLGTLPAR